jgi:hypothetical protein
MFDIIIKYSGISNIWCILWLYPHYGALNPADNGPIILPSSYNFLFRLWFIECANHPVTTCAIAKHTIDKSAYLVKQAIKKLIAQNAIKHHSLTQSG